DTRAALDSSRRLRVVATVLMLLVLFQIYLGALVAGLDAGLTLNTWPLIDGAFIPSAERMWFVAPPWRNLFENALTVQFDHRMVAYTVWIVTLLHAIDAWRSGDNAVKTRGIFLAVLVTLQATLGIATLLFVAPLHLALAHQAFAIVVLTVAVVHAARTSDRGREMFAGEPAQQGAQ
ncbi:MAG: COX15/CtaA family protein, partial [Pseudolabrys sp.]|nr:COX15/CtaA family protein [Pseudolabrys sp.]